MKKPDNTHFILQSLICELSKVDRNHDILGSDRAENDVEHSYSVAILCWYLNDKFKLNLDIAKVLKYALVHDFSEVYAGDVNTFASKKDRELKVAREARAIDKLSKELVKFEDFVRLLNGYDTKADDESVFVWTVDKMQALILADLDNWRPYKKINISYTSFEKKHHEQLEVCSYQCQEIFEELLVYCKSTYYDRPKTTVVK